MSSCVARCVPLPLCLCLLLILPACSSENNDDDVDDGKKPAPGAIGAACNNDSNCSSGYCLNVDPFPDALCSQECAEGESCPEGSSCHQAWGKARCLSACDGDAACREGYVCDYGVCRPLCVAQADCLTPDSCFSGRCKARCEADSDCPSGERCGSLGCESPCTSDEDCFPGTTCDQAKGTCEPKPGKPLGEACTSNEQCATGYCLPTRQICSAPCTSTSGCPAGTVCGLERVDKERNGTFELAEADCIPVEGDNSVGVGCQADADCASGHCYYGFCMEGCQADADCPAMQCVEVNILLDGGLPKYRGCLPRQGTSSYTLGTFPYSTRARGFDVPPNAASFLLNVEVDSTREIPFVMQLVNPAGDKVSELDSDVCSWFVQDNRYDYAEQLSSLYVPNTPAVQLLPGVWEYYTGATDANLEVTATLQLKLGKADKGTLNINWVFLNLASHSCVPDPNLNAGSVQGHLWFSQVRSEMAAILAQGGLSLGQETFADLNQPALDVIDLSQVDVSNELQQLFASSRGTEGKSVNIYLVRSIELGGTMGAVLGVAGGIPGPVERHGLVHSGIVISMDTSCYDSSGLGTGATIAHELGHYLGLYHNQESEMLPGLSGDEVVCPCPCGRHQSCYSGWYGSWCRGEDAIPDTTTSTKNLMYYAAESTQDFDGNQLTPGQSRVILDNPLVGH